MKTNTSNKNGVHCSERHSGKPSKQDVNLPKNGTLRFQIGLLISLIAAYFVMEATFAITEEKPSDPVTVEKDDEPYQMSSFTIEKKPEIKLKSTPAQQRSKTDFEIVEDDTAIEADKEFKNTPDPVPDLNMDDIGFVKDDEVNLAPVPFDKVELVPVFPGCETLSDNEERKKCMSEAINKIVKRNFDTSIAGDYGLEGIQKIYAQFKIGKDGKVTDVKVRAPHKALENETKRVIELIPQMTPGMQRNNKVEVIFLKPIIFKVQ